MRYGLDAVAKRGERKYHGSSDRFILDEMDTLRYDWRKDVEFDVQCDDVQTYIAQYPPVKQPKGPKSAKRLSKNQKQCVKQRKTADIVQGKKKKTWDPPAASAASTTGVCSNL